MIGTASNAQDSRMFVEKMTIAGMAEVQLGKLATEHAANADVKAFGQMMVKDHTQAGQELARIATQLSVPPAKQLDQKHRELVDRLSKLRGAAFDREYMTAMVAGHEEVAAELRMRAGSRLTANEPATPGRAAGGAAPVGTSGAPRGEEPLTEWAVKTLPTVQHHLERARELQAKVGKP
jgi:putative membrane protein